MNDAAKRYSIALHDLRVSMPNAVQILRDVENFFGRPFDVHLVCDRPLSENKKLTGYIKKHTSNGSLEVVYHGVNHKCEKKGWPLLAWFHHYEAEYINDSESLREKTSKGFSELTALLGKKPGICPPCWLASQKNTLHLDSLHPMYREELLHIVRGKSRFFSSVISLGSSKKKDLLLLKPLAHASRVFSSLLGISRVRIAVHICDLSLDNSMMLFRKSAEAFESKGYSVVLQRELSR